MELVHITPEVIGYGSTADITSSRADLPAMSAELPARLSELGWNVTIIAAAAPPLSGKGLAKHVTPIRAVTAHHEVECDVFEASMDRAHVRLFLLATEPRPLVRLDETLTAGLEDRNRQLAWTLDFLAAAKTLVERLAIQPDVLHLHAEALAAALLMEPPRQSLVVSIYDPQKEAVFSAKDFVALSEAKRVEDIEPDATAAQMVIPRSDLLLLPSPGVTFQVSISKRRLELKDAIRKHPNVHGVLGGLHMGRYNAGLDPKLPARFTPEDLSGKQVCRKELQKRLGLTPRKDSLLAMVTLGQIPEDGADTIDSVAQALLDRDIQLLIYKPEGAVSAPNLERLATEHPERVALVSGKQIPLTWQFAASDIVLHAPHYAPWGRFVQLGMCFGAIPVARGTGGIDDLVVDFDPETKTGGGFKYRRESTDELLRALDRARELFADQATWQTMIRRNMQAVIPWERTTAQVDALYQSLSEESLPLVKSV